MSRLLALSLVAVLSISSASVIIKLASAPALALAFWRLAISTLIISAMFPKALNLRCVSGLNVLYVLVGGSSLGLHFITWIESLSYVPIAVSVTLVTTHPVFTALLSYLLLGERLKWRQYVGVLLCVLGVLIMSFSGSLSLHSSLGVVLALAGSATASLYFLVGRYLRRSCSLAEYVVPTYLTATFITFAASTLSGVNLVNYPLTTWLFMILLALGPMLGGHTVLNYLLRYMKATAVSTLAACEPIGATLLGVLLVGEVPDVQMVLGMLITLLGVYAVLIHEG
ncbi:MAG: DMT family transporter [Sulfolobales archaeon]